MADDIPDGYPRVVVRTGEAMTPAPESVEVVDQADAMRVAKVYATGSWESELANLARAFLAQRAQIEALKAEQAAERRLTRPAADMRGKVAQIIDGAAFSTTYEPTYYERARQKAFHKADAILALVSPSAARAEALMRGERDYAQKAQKENYAAFEKQINRAEAAERKSAALVKERTEIREGLGECRELLIAQRARAATLAGYAVHTVGCQAGIQSGERCRCGLAALLDSEKEG